MAMSSTQPDTTTPPTDPRSGPEAVDPELLALPEPPRGQRSLTIAVMAAVLAASVALISQIRADIAYFFAPSVAVDLGEARLSQPVDLPDNAFVRVRGTPMLSKTVTFTVPVTGAQYAVFPLLGQKHVFVQVPADELRDPERGARGEYFGRLVTFGSLRGRLGVVQNHLHDAMEMPATSESFVLIADQAPESYVWAPALAAVCIVFILGTLWLMLRWFRPLSLRAEQIVTRPA